MSIILALSAEDPADAVYLWFRNRAAVIISHNKKLFLFLCVLSFFFSSRPPLVVAISILATHGSNDTKHYK
jgi:hypothetical protein